MHFACFFRDTYWQPYVDSYMSAYFHVSITGSYTYDNVAMIVVGRVLDFADAQIGSDSGSMRI